jgi:hypothetical protein
MASLCCFAQAKNKDQVIEFPFEFHKNEIILQVSVNGKDPFNMMLDTGTDPSGVDLATAKELGLKLHPLGTEITGGRPGMEPFTLLNLSGAHPATRCGNVFDVTAKGTGGLSPYFFIWTNATPVSPSYAPTNLAEMTAGQGNVPVQSADAQIRSYNIRVAMSCTGGGGGGQIP